MDKYDEFWHKFLRDTNRPEDTPYLEAFHFELTQTLARELLALVLSGKKRATASSLHSYEQEDMPVPKPGDLSIVTDWHGKPWCVIETTKVTILPFKDITYDICKREGEDDNLQSWQEGHRRFYEEEGKEMGYVFTEDMPVVFEDFKVVYKRDEPFPEDT